MTAHRRNNAASRIQNARNRASGHVFEDMLDRLFSSAAVTACARILKTPEPMRPLRRTGSAFTAVYTKKAQPDYQGTIAGGRSIMLEAKFTDTDRLTQDRVTPEQTAELDLRARLGAACGVLACFSFDCYAIIPWPAWRDMKNLHGRKYLTAADCTAAGYALDIHDLAPSLAAAIKKL